MILTALLWGAGILAGVGIVAAFWNDIVKFLKKAVEKVRQLVEGVVYGCKVFVKKMREGMKEISRHYSKVDQHWEETTVTKVISESEVPPEILERALSLIHISAPPLLQCCGPAGKACLPGSTPAQTAHHHSIPQIWEQIPPEPLCLPFV